MSNDKEKSVPPNPSGKQGQSNNNQGIQDQPETPLISPDWPDKNTSSNGGFKMDIQKGGNDELGHPSENE